MPWTSADAKKHKKGLTPQQEKRWASIANSVLKACKDSGTSDCDAKAIRIANAKATGKDAIDENNLTILNFATSVKSKEIKDLTTEQTDDGLLIRGVPVFKAGTYRGTEYSIDYIDRNFIGQFSEENDTPIQADHNPSTFATLGWLKGLSRKGKVMFADFLLKDDNAIARWKKGLMKKFSIGVDMINDKLREISVVAFPYVKAAHVHSDIEEDENDTQADITNVNGVYFVTIEGEKYKAEKGEDNLWLFFPIDRRDENGDLLQEEFLNIDDEFIDNIDLKEDILDEKDIEENGDFAKISVKYKNSLPDSSFTLVKKPVRDKNRDRVLPVRDANGKISLSHTSDALAKVDKTKEFSSEIIAKAKTKLERMAKKIGIEVKATKKKLEEDKDMKDVRKIDFSKIEGDGAELLKEAVEQISTLESERDEARKTLADVKEETKKLSDSLKTAKVEKKIAELKEAGKITPAQEESTKSFMLSLADDKIDSFVAVLTNGKKVVDLDESGNADLDKDKTERGKLDVDSMTAEEINEVAEKLAKDNETSFEEALDWCYDGKIDKKGKLL